jgi:protein ImuB
LPEATLDGLRLMGLEQIGTLAAFPRAPLVRRFGALVTTRLDQACGRVPEAIEPEFPPELIQARLTFVEPLLTAEAFAIVIDRLIATICSGMERSICCSSVSMAPHRRSASARRAPHGTRGIWRAC